MPRKARLSTEAILERDQKIVRLKQQDPGLEIDDAAERFGLTKKYVYTIWQAGGVALTRGCARRKAVK